MFHGERWAAAFVDELGENAGAGLACLRALVPPVQAIPGALFGRSAARRLEKILRESIAAAGFPGSKEGAAADPAALPAAEYAVRFISLLVEKNFFKHIDPLLRRIEKLLDEQKGILDVTAESAVPPDGAFEEALRRVIMQKTGAAGIRMQSRLAPELLGGYRLRIGGFYVDASLKGQIEQMAANLAAPFTSAPAPKGA